MHFISLSFSLPSHPPAIVRLAGCVKRYTNYGLHLPLQAGEMGQEGATSTPTAPPECRLPQEATTATQTEAGVFSIHPQRPLHTFSLTGGASTLPPASLSATTPAESPWQAPPPPPAPLPSPNHNPGGGELAESAACGGPVPAPQPGSWNAEGLSSPTSPLGAGRGEVEQEEAMMDDLGEPTLVHTLAEADQSQGESSSSSWQHCGSYS